MSPKNDYENVIGLAQDVILRSNDTDGSKRNK